mgnify:CR=1 FL=1
MKAAVLEKLNSPLVIDELEIPSLECGQVLVEVKRSGICGAQIGEIAGVKGEDKYLPHLMGHEGGGIVVDVGPGVTKIKKNDHVVMHWRKGLGIEARPPKYKRNAGFVGGGWITTFNEFAVISENRVTPIPEDIPFEIAALMGCAVTTALGLVNNEAQLKIGQSIAVAGCGGVGLNVIQGSAMVSAYPIIAIDLFDHKLKLAQEFGATHLINSSKEDIRESIKKIVGKTGVDVFIDCTGKVDIMEQCYELTAPNGRTILVGQPRFEHDLVLRSMVRNFTGKILTDSQGGQTDPTVDIPRYLNLYRSGKLKLDRLITHRFSLGEINLAIEKIKNGETGRCIIEF